MALRLAILALSITTFIACSGDVDVESTDDNGTGAVAGSAGGSGTDVGGGVGAPGADTPRAVAGGQSTVDRPVISTEEQTRIDAWLTFFADSLNDYGDPEGTMYAGGTPLFNEAQGKPVSKYEYIAVKHPEKPWNQPLPATRPVKKPDTASKKKSDNDDDKESSSGN